MEIEMDRQLFVLGAEIWSSIDKEGVLNTGKSMRDAGIFNYPYEEFDLSIYGKTKNLIPWIFGAPHGADEYWKKLIEDETPSQVHYRYYDCKGKRYKYAMRVDIGGDYVFLPGDSEELLSKFSSIGPDQAKYMNDMAADAFLDTLLVLLATRNIEKEILESPRRYKDPSSSGGVKQIRNKDYQYITTIKIGKITETLRSSATSRGPVRAHLRRGHIRNQRFGEGLKEVKQVFIQPVFVNADEGWIENQRKEYRVKM